MDLVFIEPLQVWNTVRKLLMLVAVTYPPLSVVNLCATKRQSKIANGFYTRVPLYGSHVKPKPSLYQI